MSSKKKPPNPGEEQLPPESSVEINAEKDTESSKQTDDRLSILEKEALKLAEELFTERDKCLRIMAEYDNFRKRSQKERESIYSDVRGDTVLKFLPVYDNLERALKQETADEAYRKGVELIMAQYLEIMEKLGVAEIDAGEGTAFDPAVHNAVMHVENESFGENVIVEEFQKGFRLGDKVIRFSVVKVAN